MPRPFKAPIPVFRKYGDEGTAPGSMGDFAYSLLYEEGVQRWIIDRLRERPGDPLMRYLLAQIKGAWPAIARVLMAVEMANYILEAKTGACRAAREFEDALVVDDYFRMFIDPTFDDDILAFFKQIDMASGNDREAQGAVLQDLKEWLGKRAPHRFPGLRRDSVPGSLGEPRDAGPPCWHVRPHAYFATGGRRQDVTRRAATWGTYVVSWIMGSDTLAVRLWNKTLLPAGFRWGDGRSDDYAVKKYLQAKGRLIDDLKKKGGRAFVPDPTPVLKHYRTPHAKLIAMLEQVIEADTRSRIRIPSWSGTVIRTTDEESLSLPRREPLTDAQVVTAILPRTRPCPRPNCGGSILAMGDGMKCLLCGREVDEARPGPGSV